MSHNETGIIIYVTYQGPIDAHFDRDYYLSDHLPLVMASWRKYGLESLKAFFPAIAQEGTLAICECRFRNEASVTAAFSSLETPAVMADVARFTNLAPLRARAMPL